MGKSSTARNRDTAGGAGKKATPSKRPAAATKPAKIATPKHAPKIPGIGMECPFKVLWENGHLPPADVLHPEWTGPTAGAQKVEAGMTALASRFLESLTGHHLEALKAFANKKTDGRVAYGTMCSGTDVASVCNTAMSGACTKAGIDLELRQNFACEKDTKTHKRFS